MKQENKHLVVGLACLAAAIFNFWIGVWYYNNGTSMVGFLSAANIIGGLFNLFFSVINLTLYYGYKKGYYDL